MTTDRQSKATASELAEQRAGGSEVLIIETLVFDESQITSPTNGNHPRCGECCHSQSRECGRAVGIVKYEDEQTTDSVPGRYNHQDR